MNPSELFTIPPSADLAYGWISTLIPLTGSAYSKALATFSGTLVFIGSLVLAWHIIIGVVSSAYTGRVLGDRFHQIYAPLRVVLGFALLIPIGEGFSAVHFLLRNVIGVAAIQLGNAPIKSYLGELSTGGSIGIPSSTGSEVVKNILDKELCIRIHNGLQEHRWFNRSAKFTPEFGEVSVDGASYWFSWTDPDPQSYYKWDYGPCGSYSFLMGIGEESESRNTFYAVRRDATSGIQEFVAEKLDSVRIGEFFGTHELSEPDSLVLDGMISQGYMLPTIRDISRTVADWNRTVGDAASAVYAEESGSSISELKDSISNYGFMAAGGFERHLSQISKLTMELSNQSLVSVGPSLDSDVLEEVEKARNLLQIVSIRDSIGNAAPGTSASVAGEYSSLNDLQSEISAYFVVPEPARNPDGLVTDPVGSMIQRGHYFIVSAAAAGTALAAASGFASSLDNDAVGMFSLTATEALGGALKYSIGWATWAVTLMFLVGLLHAYVLPMIPFLMVFIMGISWLILFLEASIAGILWAFAFIRMDGQEFIDRHQAPGVALLFNLLLRPAIGMLAFIGGLILLPTVLRSLLFIWNGVWDAQQYVDGTLQTASRGLTWPLTFIAEYVLFLFLQWHLTLRIFGLVPTIADRVGNWVGYSMGQGYNESGETSSAVSGSVGFGMNVKSAPMKAAAKPFRKRRRF